ncbi:hypothetical protein Catovirus_1_49 [Catovirus CTV1]|uniref:Uncharacterized protein n=1 Tax=Catovirus CTV1 TaxID=1977631 RepID=A0A1V0S8G9_9VIRU|nr:hypothetical protein Catovirus_1_49 [Catovirus CTV1]
MESIYILKFINDGSTDTVILSHRETNYYPFLNNDLFEYSNIQIDSTNILYKNIVVNNHLADNFRQLHHIIMSIDNKSKSVSVINLNVFMLMEYLMIEVDTIKKIFDKHSIGDDLLKYFASNGFDCNYGTYISYMNAIGKNNYINHYLEKNVSDKFISIATSFIIGCVFKNSYISTSLLYIDKYDKKYKDYVINDVGFNNEFTANRFLIIDDIMILYIPGHSRFAYDKPKEYIEKIPCDCGLHNKRPDKVLKIIKLSQKTINKLSKFRHITLSADNVVLKLNIAKVDESGIVSIHPYGCSNFVFGNEYHLIYAIKE